MISNNGTNMHGPRILPADEQCRLPAENDALLCRQALSLFVNVTLPDVAVHQPKMLWTESMLGGACTLFGRKFAADTAEQLQACLFDCKSELEFTAAGSITFKVVRHDSHSEA